MALNLKNKKTEFLAHQLTALTKESLTEAITVALQERLQRLQGSGKRVAIAAALHEISQRCANMPTLDERSPDAILGYDPAGLPK